MESTTSVVQRRGRLHKRVEDVMHSGVISCGLEATVPDVARLMTRHDISAVPVVDDNGYLAGIITRTDLVILRGYEDYWRELCAENVMVRDVATVTPDQTVADVSRLMADKHVHRLIVCQPDSNGGRRPIGVISQTDIVRDMSLD
jgi:CBS domain-containing protein